MKYAISFEFEEDVADIVKQDFIEVIYRCGFTEYINKNLYAFSNRIDSIRTLLSLKENLSKEHFGDDLSFIREINILLLLEYENITPMFK